MYLGRGGASLPDELFVVLALDQPKSLCSPQLCRESGRRVTQNCVQGIPHPSAPPGAVLHTAGGTGTGVGRDDMHPRVMSYEPTRVVNMGWICRCAGMG